MSAAGWIAVIAGLLVALDWLWCRVRGPRFICDVCFQRVEPGVGMCPHCGTVFGDPTREQHEVVPETWVAAQSARLRTISYAEVLARLDSPEQFDVPVDDGRFVLCGETVVFWDDPKKRAGDLRVIVAIWNDAGGRALASDDFIRSPDGSAVGE